MRVLFLPHEQYQPYEYEAAKRKHRPRRYLQDQRGDRPGDQRGVR